MGWKLRCAVLGHDDRTRSGGGRVYLECEECGRKTNGWQLEQERRFSPPRGVPPLVVFQHLAHTVWQRVTSAVRP